MERDANLHLTPDRCFLSFNRKERGTTGPLPIKNQVSIILNTIAGEILSQVDGETSLLQLTEYFVKKYNEQPDIAKNNILSFFQQLNSYYDINILLSDKPCEKEIKLTGNLDYFIPLSMPIEITYNCNLFCLHCYAAKDIYKNPPQMEADKLYELLNELKNIGVKTIEFTGGEPTSHPDFTKILDYTYALDFELVGILTNGTLLNNDMINCIVANKEKTVVQIDLHGKDKKYVEWFTGSPTAF